MIVIVIKINQKDNAKIKTNIIMDKMASSADWKEEHRVFAWMVVLIQRIQIKLINIESRPISLLEHKFK